MARQDENLCMEKSQIEENDCEQGIPKPGVSIY